jgi:hypothetical protein
VRCECSVARLFCHRKNPMSKIDSHTHTHEELAGNNSHDPRHACKCTAAHPLTAAPASIDCDDVCPTLCLPCVTSAGCVVDGYAQGEEGQGTSSSRWVKRWWWRGSSGSRRWRRWIGRVVDWDTNTRAVPQGNWSFGKSKESHSTFTSPFFSFSFAKAVVVRLSIQRE